MKMKSMIILALVACPLAPGAEPASKIAGGRLKIRDVVTHEELSARLQKTSEPLLELKQEDPIQAKEEGGEVWKPTSLLARSEFLSFNGLATMVPKGAVLNVPSYLATRLKLASGTRIINWNVFYPRNRSWITTVEVTRSQAEGNEPIAEATLKSISESKLVVIATMQGGPISVLPPKEPVDPAAPVVPADPKIETARTRTAVMKTFRIITLSALMAVPAVGFEGFTNFVRQIQVGSGIEWDVTVGDVGEQLSPLSINPGGARFELWTVRNSPISEHLLDHKLVGEYTPQADVLIYSEDPYAVIPRTRADRPFWVRIPVSGLLPEDPAAPDGAKRVKLQRFLQTYPDTGDMAGYDRSGAVMHAEAFVDQNVVFEFNYPITSLPGGDRTQVAGEETFTVMSLADYQAPASQLASTFIQIWPVATGQIVGLANGQKIEFSMPAFEIHLDELYPDSHTYAQVYRGSPSLGTVGTVVPGSVVNLSDSVPQDRVLRIKDWDKALQEDGVWTLEVLHKTPFGLERLDYVTFDIDRTLEVHGSVTTIE